MQAIKSVLAILAISTAAQAHAAIGTAADPVRLHGTVIVSSNKYETMFVVRSGDSSGPAAHIFRVWANPGLALDVAYRGADIEFYGTSLIVIAPTAQAVVTFAIGGSTAPPVPHPEGFRTTSYGVAGLAHDMGDRPRHRIVNTGGVVPVESCDASCDEYGFEVPDPWNYGAGGATCTSGGPNSTSCSQTSSGGTCSVSCTNGTYACCTASAMTPPKCFCVK